MAESELPDEPEELAPDSAPEEIESDASRSDSIDPATARADANDHQPVESTSSGESGSALAEDLSLAGADDSTDAAEPSELDAGSDPIELTHAGESVSSAGTSADPTAASLPAHPPFLGPVTDLNDLPQPMIAELDQKAAGEMQDAINNPEKYPADHLDYTSIRGLNATGAPGEQKKDGDPWYHRGLPPLHFEVALVGYDWMVGEAIDRAARHINELTEAKAKEKVQEAMWQLRTELSVLSRYPGTR